MLGTILLTIALISSLFIILGVSWIIIENKLYTKKGLKYFFRNENHNYIPDGLEDVARDVKNRIKRVKEEAKDVSESFQDLKDQTQDVVDAALGKEKIRRGRPKK